MVRELSKFFPVAVKMSDVRRKSLLVSSYMTLSLPEIEQGSESQINCISEGRLPCRSRLSNCMASSERLSRWYARANKIFASRTV
jgi:hypothetical protein